MNIFVVIQQMLVLLSMMLIGYIVFRIKWLDSNACSRMSKIVINVMNPCLMISGVMGSESGLEGSMLFQTLILVVIYYAVLILLSGPVAKILRAKKEHYNLYKLMLIFSNVGFMGIPVISSIFGKESMLLIVFYNMGFSKSSLKEREEETEKKNGGQWKKLINPGVVACVVTIVIFLFGLDMPESVCTFFEYVGNAAVPVSMMLIGASVAQGGKLEFFLDKRAYGFMAVKLLLIPICAALLLRLVPWPAMVEGVFVLMLAMPVGSIVVMLATESGADEMECTKGIILTTLMSVITIPIVSAFL